MEEGVRRRGEEKEKMIDRRRSQTGRIDRKMRSAQEISAGLGVGTTSLKRIPRSL